LKSAPASSTEIRKEIASDVGNQLNYHLEILVDSGAVTREKRLGFRQSFFSPTEAARAQWIATALKLTAAED
jgi:hypothetical protein